MSTNTKRLLLILGIAAIFCFVSVVVAIAGIGLFANRIKDGITSDQPKIQQMAHEFINYELPPDYVEEMGMDFIIYKMILIESPDKTDVKPIIFLAHFQGQNLTPEQMTRQMQQSVEQQSGRNGLKFKVVETRDVTIDGHQTSLSISEGRDKYGESIRQWMTVFPAKKGMILILIQGAVDDWDDSIFESFFASIST